MLGRYQNFPEIIHGMARFTFLSSQQELQRAILQTMHRLNHKAYSLKDLTPFRTSECEVSFEFGVAEDMTFNYLDKEELERISKRVETKPLRVIDVFSVIRYHVNAKSKRRPLKFDYNMLRFTFSRKTMEVFVAHQRGNQRVSIEDFIRFLTNQIDKELMRENQKTLVLKYLRTL
jgi:hypothetical protein